MPGARRFPASTSSSSPSTPCLHRLHYDVVSNATLWFLHHGLFDLARRPRFDEHFREAWEGYVAVNEAFADCGAEPHAGPARRCWSTTTSSRWCPGMVRAARPDLALLHFTHTPFCGPNSIRVLPTDVAVDLCRSMASVPSGFHTARWARAYEASARTMLGAEAAITPSFATPLGPDPDALAEEAPARSCLRCGAELDELVGDRKLILRTDRIDPAKNIVRGFLAFDELLTRHAEWRERVVFVARLDAVAREPRRVPRVRPGGRARCGSGQRALGARRLAAGRHRHPRRLRAQHRRLRPLRRAVREPGEGRPEPRGQGRPARQPARRRAVSVTRSRLVRRAARRRGTGAPLRHLTVGGRAP